jgi:hypothetical protein
MVDSPPRKGDNEGQRVQLCSLTRCRVSIRPGPLRRRLLVASSHSASDMADVENAQTLYFGYGSNVWMDQMNRRCPESRYIATAVLHDW